MPGESCRVCRPATANIPGPGPPLSLPATLYRLCGQAFRARWCAPRRWRWGFCTMRSLLAACRRRVAPLHGAIPPFGAGAAAVQGGVAPTSQTTSVKNADNGLLMAKWSAFWTQRCLSWGVVRTLTPGCARKPLDTHVNPSICTWAALPTRISSGPRATCRAQATTCRVNVRMKGPARGSVGPCGHLWERRR